MPKLSKNRKPSLIWSYPGEVLKEEFLLPLGISAYRLAKDTGLPQTRISEILREKRRITADTALRLGKYFGVSPRFWLGLQGDYDLEEERATIGVLLHAGRVMAEVVPEAWELDHSVSDRTIR